MTKLSELPKHENLFLPVVRAMRLLGGSADNDQLVEKVTELLDLSDELTSIPHKAGPRSEISYRIAWVKSWLKWAQMLDNPQRGVWALTQLGRDATDDEIEIVPVRRRGASSAKRGNQPKATAKILSDEPVDLVEESQETDEDEWKLSLLNVIKSIEAAAFERLSRLLLLRLGFSHVEVTGRSGDGGIDLMGTVRVNNVISFRVLAQCKRYRDSVGPGDIRNFRGAMSGRTDKGLFITTGRFTREAKREATRDGVPSIDLIDGDELCVLLKDLAMGVETKTVERVFISPAFFKSI